ncbi:hypothetical protein AB0K09_29905, partial [Streptomyces sp. NPDC049577]|uniref:hypothetical protein n=1 Tax=Streptomyces sp. NPDC049577 TaxID=3155153 RepID=UPI00343C40E4
MTTTPDSAPRPRTTAASAQHRTRFFDHRVPSLSAGRYEIRNQQILRDVDGADRVIDALPQPFEVVQPRFALPATAVNARFPVPDAEGTYSQTLPHINLDVPGLPWSRPLGPGHPAGVPWTALLLFREGELPEDPEAVGLVTAGTVRQLLARELGPGTPPALDPDSLPGDDQDQHCATVLVPAALFDAVKPLPEEMGYLAHVREGGPADATLSDSDPEPDEQELNAVVVANRFPAAAGGRHVVHLVSLEGFDAYLDAPAPGDGVRLVSLTSWTFTSEADSGTGFADLAQHLATSDGTTPRPADELRLAVPVAAPANPSAHEREVVDRMAGGGVALPQRLETGERTVAFHRGPLTARPAQSLPAPAATRLESPGEALVYLESYGVFDTAYAAAFTAGRTLALADETFRAALLEFRSAGRRALRRLAAHPRAAAAGTASAPRLLTASPAFDAFDRMLQDREGERFVAAVEQSGPRLRARPHARRPGRPAGAHPRGRWHGRAHRALRR